VLAFERLVVDLTARSSVDIGRRPGIVSTQSSGRWGDDHRACALSSARR
jgi:hypothetical protein